jgi:hypothetical protein
MLIRRKKNKMKRTKLILIAMLSVLTLNSFAQSITAVVTPATSDTLCNGSTIFTGAPVSANFIWMQQGTTPISTTTQDSTAYNLCPGIYNVEVWNAMSDTMYYDTVITILSPSTHLGVSQLFIEPKVIRVLDIMGNDSELISNKPLILVYNNGTRKKKYVIEN